MDIENVKKYIGKKVHLVLKNNFRYTAIIPDFEMDSFTIVDKFGKEIEITCDYISFLAEVDKHD